MKLIREEYGKYGIFGILAHDDGEELLLTLEHAYDHGGNTFISKVPIGTYECKRGIHQLGDRPPFETFEITGVNGHTGILFHSGNTNADSNGCVLLGLSRNYYAVLHSRDAFNKFMKVMEGIETFSLEVS